MTANRDQEEFWTDQAGPVWVRHHAATDALFQPVLDRLLDMAELCAGQAVLDIGCGAGGSTFQAADRVAPGGHATGLDISKTLLDLAETRLAGRGAASFVLADAARHRFASPHDALISRFGLMFFDDPVAGFRNIAHNLRPGARMTFATWGTIKENPYFTHAAQAARAVLGPVPKTDPDAPGPFAFRAPDRVLAILKEAGLKNSAVDVQTLHLTPSGSLDDFTDMAMQIGPAPGALAHHNADASATAAVRDAIRAVFAPFDGLDGLKIPAEINFFTATV